MTDCLRGARMFASAFSCKAAPPFRRGLTGLDRSGGRSSRDGQCPSGCGLVRACLCSACRWGTPYTFWHHQRTANAQPRKAQAATHDQLAIVHLQTPAAYHSPSHPAILLSYIQSPWVQRPGTTKNGQRQWPQAAPFAGQLRCTAGRTTRRTDDL